MDLLGGIDMGTTNNNQTNNTGGDNNALDFFNQGAMGGGALGEAAASNQGQDPFAVNQNNQNTFQQEDTSQATADEKPKGFVPNPFMSQMQPPVQ